jgi:hypothetical protein
MLNYIVDDLDVLLDRLAKEGVRIDPKRQNESYGRFLPRPRLRVSGP